MEKKLQFTDVTLRDAHQSLFATRMKTKDMIDIAPVIDKAGFWSVEMWGGATFDACLRFLREDPWERLKILRKLMPNSKLQMLLRGQNLVGYRHYPDDVVKAFVRKAAENGIDVFRVFDALNDLRNVEVAVETAKECGKIVEGAISYTISPVHTEDLYVELALQYKDMGVDIITIKDMASLLSPEKAYSLVKAIKEETGLPVHIHTHCTSGMAEMTQLKAAEAGADLFDVAISPMASDTSHPATETMAYVLKELGYEIDLDKEALAKMAKHFKEVRKHYQKYDMNFKGVDAGVLEHQIPGGMMSNLVNQLKEQGALDRLEEVLKEIPRVREDLGYPPLVTPTSQIVGTQAVLNVLAGERYKMITQETKNYVKGLYGKPPAPIKEEIIKKILGDEQPITCRPADLLEPELERRRKEIEGLARSEEDVLSYCLFPQVAKEFFEWREKVEKGEIPAISEEDLADTLEEEKLCPQPLAPTEFIINVHGESYHVKIAGVGHKTDGKKPYFIKIDGRLEEVVVEPLVEVVPTAGEVEISGGLTSSSKRPKAIKEGDVTSPMPAKVVEIKVKEGDQVNEGDVVAIVEAMKMQNEVHAPISGTVKAIYVKPGDQINPDEVIMTIE
ncbi:sodium-extruding oxaloacetate decarboxylase subunit alpha [Desulfurobacterium indicum]|uniref:Oxaloacetate decarboxylase subunit alpha n=1 Tax=Desulfurobacterium indicum TaxID=1914305 RepID=A0A1R1MN38_9BACT|nr:sodium-extruding oxaloacetate decarboxylase subunit alpha [Desulfurobacterium indicum]OMH41130.1 oxaloacetate decarboxylase subunit alpha [Desulfurobacterium indicum]